MQRVATRANDGEKKTLPLPYVAAVALTAAAFGDYLVESLSNAGLFGQAFFGNDLSSVTPTLAAALILVLVIAWSSFARRKSGRADWVVALAARVARRSSAAAIAWTFVVQLGVLFAIGSCEQLADFGHLAGGAVWLGGPVVASLAIHAVICIAVTLSLVHVCRALGSTIAALVSIVTQLVLALRARSGPATISLRTAMQRPRIPCPDVRRTRGRSPPLYVQFV